MPQEVISEVNSLQRSGLCMEDIISRLRSRTVPSGFPFHNWREGTQSCKRLIMLSRYIKILGSYYKVISTFSMRVSASKNVAAVFLSIILIIYR